MKKIICLAGFIFFSVPAITAQDEGTITKKARIDRSNGIFIGLGPSFTLGKNIGDYSTGFNIEAGFLKRVNRILSIGPSFSHLNFKYDPEKTGFNNIFTGNEQYDGNYYYFTGLLIDFEGGDLSLTSIAFNLKLNFIPVKDNSSLSLYVFAKPFVTLAQRKEVIGKASVFNVYDLDDDGNYDDDEIFDGFEDAYELPWRAQDPEWMKAGIEISEDLKEDTRITGGIFIGPGVEYAPAKKISVYAQAAFGYTFPISFVSTKKYEGGNLNDIDEKYPITEEGFPSVNLQFGISFNL